MHQAADELSRVRRKQVVAVRFLVTAGHFNRRPSLPRPPVFSERVQEERHARTYTHAHATPPTHTQPPAAPARADRTGSKDATAVKAEKAPPTAERRLSPKVAEKFATESAETASTCSLRLSRGERVLDQTGGRPCRLQCYATKGSIPPDASDASPPPRPQAFPDCSASSARFLPAPPSPRHAAPRL